MRLTRLGWGCLLLSGLSLLSAFATGNNLLYLLYGTLASALLVSAAAGRLNLARLRAQAEAPDMVFRGDEYPLRVTLHNDGLWAARGVEVAGAGRRAWADAVEAGRRETVELRHRLERRGVNRVSDLGLESSFPFGLLRHRREAFGPGGALVTALPRLRDAQASAEIRAEVKAEGTPTRKKGVGDELYGIREYDSSDDSRSINWKLTAKAGRPLVNEFCTVQDSKVTVALSGVTGEGAEDRIEEAASACKFHLDRGLEVRLVTPEEEVPYGRGLLHLDRILRSLALAGDGRLPRAAGGPPAPAPPVPADSKALRRLSLAGAFLVYAGLFLVDEIDAGVLLLAFPVLPLAVLVQERGWPRVPEAAWNIMSLLVLFYTVLVDWPRSGVIIADTHLITYLLVNRCLTVFRREDLSQLLLILALAFFLVSGLTISLWYFAVYILFCSFVAAWSALALGLSPARWRDWAPSASAAALSVFAGAAGLFLATPRIEGMRRYNPFLAAGIDKLAVRASAAIGFTENVSLGGYGELRRSSSRVIRIKPSTLPPGKKPPPLHVRGAAFEIFDGRRWSKPRAVNFSYRQGARAYTSAGGRVYARKRGDRLLFPIEPRSEGYPSFEFTVYPMGQSVLFSVGTPWMIEPMGEAAYFDYTDTIYLMSSYMRGLTYRLYSNSGASGFGSFVPGFDRGPKTRFLQLPKARDERVRELALRVTAGAAEPLSKARAIERHLQRGYSYSLFSEDQNMTLEDFLFKAKKGNCEYFATAGAILARHAGLRSRLVTGFLADEWNEFGSFYDVRQSQAHAWVEVEVPGLGWLTMDPTPAGGGFAARADALGRRLERYFNAVQAEWFRRVIGYDQYSQRNTFLQLSLSLPPKLVDWLLRALLAAAALLGLGLLVRGWGGFVEGLRARRRADFYQRAQALLSRAGLPREANLTPREFALRVAKARPELSGVGALAELHYLERYAGRGLSEGETEEARRLFEELRARL